MYVRWKVLLSLGVLFWCLSCLNEYFLHPNTEISLVSDKPHSVIKFGNEFTESKEEATNLVKIIIWNCVAFVSTLGVCFTLKSLVKLWFARRGRELFTNTYEDGDVPLKKNRSSKIPIPVTGKSSSTDIHIDGVNVILSVNDETNKSCPNFMRTSESSDGENNKEKNDDKFDNKVWSIRNMEKHCAKLREEMINLQASSLKEHSSMSKKMGALAKEKRDLVRQLKSLHKENTALKQKVEEMLEERRLLIQRLDCATKEIRINTKSKKTTMMKLEEALTNAELLKSNLEQISQDKLMLENKLILLNAEYARLKEELKLQQNSGEITEEEEKKEQVIDAFGKESEVSANIETQEKTSDFDISQTEDNMKKMQERLMTLEKSLDCFKFRQDTPSNDEEETADENAEAHVLREGESMSTIDEEPSTKSICTELSCPLEYQDCNTTEYLKNVVRKLRLEENAEFSSGDESLSFNKSLFRRAEKPHENPSSKLRPVKYIKSTISDDRLSVISERVVTGEESGDDYEPHRRISKSPEFQEFLKKVTDPSSNDSRFTQKLDIALINYCGV